MPQFRMPDARAPRPRDADAERPPRDADRDDGRPGDAEVVGAGERRIRRSHVAIAVVALLVGVGGTLGAQAVAALDGPRSERAAGEAALAYLQAVAAGADEAAERALLPSAERAAATPSSIAEQDRLRSPRISQVQLGDGTARVDVSYVVDDRTTLRRVDAVWADGAWRMLRTLGEPVPLAVGLSVPVRVDTIAVVPATRSLLLLPGVHRVAPIDAPLVTMEGATVAVDGDPRTPVAIDLDPALTAEAVALLRAAAVARLEACIAAGSCAVPAGIDPQALPDPVVTSWTGPAGEVAVELPIAQGGVTTSMLVVGRMGPDLDRFETIRCALALDELRPCDA